MINEAKDGGFAYPQHGWTNNPEILERMKHQGGMSLRDYFAAKAMAAMITKSTGQDSTGGKGGVPLVAKYAYEYADAMLKARAA